MKKEVVFAILIGFGIGLLITFGIYQAQQAYQVNNSNPPQNPDQTLEQAPLSASNLELELTSPTKDSVLESASIELVGNTAPFAYVTAVSTSDESFTQADSNGQFLLPFTLDQGANLITLTSVSSGETTSLDRLLVFSPPTPQATPSANNQTTDD